MKSNYLPEQQFVGNISLSNSGKSIVKLFSSEDKYYIHDVILSTSYQKYYAYEVSKDNILKFIESENNKYLLPSKKQVMYKIHFFDYKILGVDTYDYDIHLSSFEDDLYVCEDKQIILKQLKPNENELSRSF